jgi:hypothetical protein
VIDLFERGAKLMRRRQTESIYNELNEISCQLARELQLKPWVPCPLLQCDDDQPPDYTTGDLAIANWWRSKGIRRELEAAVQARRECARSSGSSAPPTESAPVAAAPHSGE